jgi:hypothetical protein
MMRFFIALATISIVLQAQEPTTRSIELEVDHGDHPLPLGASIKIRAKYVNGTRWIWTIRDPLSSHYVYACYKRIGKPMSIKKQRLCKTDPREIEADIKMNDDYKFIFELGENWNELETGVYDIWIEDFLEEISSNRVRVVVEFSAESIPIFVKTIEDSKESTTRLRLSHDWLRKVYPRFQLEIIDSACENKEKK